MSIRYRIDVAYDGTNYHGFQIQPHGRTIQGVITRVVNKIAKNPQPKINIVGSGRTDAGVHALNQVIHFDFPFKIDENNMFKAMNSMLPLDIIVKRVKIVSKNFHARYNVSGKRYMYKIDLGKFRDPFKRFYTGHWRAKLNLAKLKLGLNDLIGTHDFTSFVASGSEAKSNIRTIYEAKYYLDSNKNELIFEFYGNGFLYNMVRIMVGVLVEIGSGYREPHDILRLYHVKDRTEARRTASPNGLYLKHVYYEYEDPEHPTKTNYKNIN